MVPPDDAEARARMLGGAVRQLMGALAARDGAAVASLLTDDVVYHFPGRNQLSGTYRGKPEVMAFFQRFPTVLDAPPALDTHDVLSSEAHGADLTSLTAQRGGRQHAWRAVRIYHFVEDLISEVFVVIEDQAALDEFLGPAESA